MQTNNSNQPTIEARLRVLFILWFAICTSVLLFLLVVVGHFAAARVDGNPRLSLILNSIAIVPAGLSFLLKQQMLNQAVAQQKLDLVQTAYIMAWALCEMSALLGLMDRLLNGSLYYYLGFIFAALGLLLHFPRKQHLLDASQRQN